MPPPAQEVYKRQALCYPITWTAASAMFLIYYKFGHWLPAYPQKRVEIG